MKATGCLPSKKDKRHFTHVAKFVKATPLTTGGVIYQPSDIEDQHTVGICTDIDIDNQGGKVYGKKYSADFGYLIQKKFIDGNWDEGSSIFSALKSKQKFGFLPTEYWTYTTEEDRKLPYAGYIAKLQAVSDAEIQRLLGLCEHKLLGYAKVGTDPASIAQAIMDCPTGIECMYLVGNEWWSADGVVTYDPAKIDPLKAPKQVVSGHSIKATFFDFTKSPWLLHANTWGTDYDLQGNCHIAYEPLEAWVPYFNTGAKYLFNVNFGFGTRSIDVKELQKRLNMPVENQTGFFGPITMANVIKYQAANKILPTGFVGPLTRARLNS